MKKTDNNWFIMAILTIALFIFPSHAFASGLQSTTVKKGSTDISGMVVSIGEKGFNPSEDNYLRIKANVSMKNKKTQLRLRILNTKGECVFYENFSSLKVGSGNEDHFFDYRWDGKADKENDAGLTAGEYVPNGKYRIELLAYYYVGKQLYGTRKYLSIRVSDNAATGEAGVGEAFTVPVFTGFAGVDYLAQIFIKEAGVEDAMSDDEKVQRIYHWMTMNFKHVHSGSRYKYPLLHDLDAVKTQVDYYKKKCDKYVEDGVRIYSYECARCEDRMTHHYGVCTDHAAIFKLLLNHVGVEAGICRGYYIYRNGSRTGHYWNYAIVDGVKYYYDVDVEIQNYGKGQGDYYWYKDTRAETLKRHSFIQEEWYLYNR